MSPRQTVVVENSALRRFMKKHGYCISAAWLAGQVEVAMKLSTAVKQREGNICCGELTVEVKRRGDQWFVTNIEKS